MARFFLPALAVLLAWLGLSAGPAAAQNVYPFQQPRFGPGWQTPLSPYLNMLIPGNAAVNYFALVQPQFQRRQYYNQMNQTIQGIMNQLPPPPGIVEEDFDAPLPSTGHPTAFNYTGSHFNSTIMGQSMISAFPQTRMGAGMMGPGRRPGLPGRGGGAGIWPNMRPGMMPGR